jgi:hypothetical protein
MAEETVVLEENKPIGEQSEIKSDETPIEKTPEQIESEKAKAEEEKKEKAHNRVQKRIDQLTREKYELKGELEAYKKLGVVKPSENVIHLQEPVKPVRANFNSDADFIEASNNYSEFISQKTERVAQQKPAQQFNGEFEKSETSLRDEVEDYDDVIEDAKYSVRNFDKFVDYVKSLDVPDSARVAFEIAKDKVLADKIINGMPLEKANIELGKIFARIEKAEKKEVKPSNAPAPIKPPTGGSPSKLDVNDPKVPIDDWMRQRQERIKNKRK